MTAETPTTDPVRVRDAATWAWFEREVRNQRPVWATPGCVIPSPYEAVARVLHPARDGSTWAQVATESGRTAHALMEWSHIEARCGVPSRSGDGVLALGDRAIPRRDYRIFRTPTAAQRVWPGLSSRTGHSPNVVWPADHTWVVASDLDWMFTLVAGTEALVDEVVADPRLEAYQVAFGARLGGDGDTLNEPFS